MPTQLADLEETILTAIGAQPGMGILLAIVFGSLAAGEGRAQSDLDLAVDAGRHLACAEKVALISELAAVVKVGVKGEPETKLLMPERVQRSVTAPMTRLCRRAPSCGTS